MSDLTTTPDERQSDMLARPLAVALSLDWEKVAFAAFIAMALITRLWGLGTRAMSHDESLHTQYSLQFVRGDGYSHTPLMHGPLLFHVTALSYWLFGATDFASRLPVALLGVVLVAMPYFLRRWLGRTGALVASFLFLISPFITYYSRYIRHDIYVIVWALIVFIASWYYLRQRKEKYLLWFAAGLALMFSTKEVAFIYVAIFGSFLVGRLALRVWQADWLQEAQPRLRQPLLVLAAGGLLLAVGFAGLHLERSTAASATATATATDDQGFAADPNAAEQTTTVATDEGAVKRVLHWLQVAGALGIAAAAFLFARALRPEIDEFPEFDLIALYSTLVLPLIAPFLVTLAGIPVRNYTINRCELAGQASMSQFQYWLAQVTNPTCLQALLSSNIVIYAFFVVIVGAAAVAAGLWWNRRRWLAAAILFHAIFFLLHTSVFTNPTGWFSGLYDSLAYWLEQQGVERGSQPWFYYIFIVPFYEFLPLVLALLAIRLWAVRRRLNKIISYWITLILLTLLAYSFSNWIINRPIILDGGTPSNLAPLIIAGVLFFAGLIYWFMVRQRQLRDEYRLGRSWSGLLDANELLEFVPSVIWWFLLTWAAYSVAGEKMPWLSTHFVIPMALLGGWYLNEKLTNVDAEALRARRTVILIVLIAAFLAAAFVALSSLLLGEFRLGDQNLANLRALGRFLGGVVVAGGLFYLIREVGERMNRPIRRRAWLLAILSLLALLTVRFTYMANWPNADYATEFMVYAHAAPAVKESVLSRIEQLSMRLKGDRTMRVAWSDDGTWPMQWYLRNFPNRFFTGKNPSASIRDYPVVVAGQRDWDNFEPFLKDDEYIKEDYVFLWWPMEEYRKIGWNALFGLASQRDDEGNAETGRGILNPQVRQALWDIFFHREYKTYGEVFGGSYAPSQWPLRAPLRLYIRRDVVAHLWDYGVGAASIEPPVDPYAEGERQVTPDLVIGAGGVHAGELLAPRNVAVGPDGNLYVLDSGNHRVVVFDSNGQMLRDWGSFGQEPGQFNEPWGIAVDDSFLYVADTWNHRVQKFSQEGDLVTTFGQSGTTAELGAESGGFFFGPRSITLLPDDRLAVTDTGNHRLQIFDRDGNFVRVAGGPGAQPGLFNEPVGLATGDAGVYLADTWNARIQLLTSSLSPVLEWPIDGWEGDSTENKPYLAVDSAGRVYATDPENFRVLIFEEGGEYLARFGQPGTELDRLGLPNGIAIDDGDNVYVTDARNNRVLRFPALDFGDAPAPAEDEAPDVMEEAPAEEEEEPETESDGGAAEPTATPGEGE